MLKKRKAEPPAGMLGKARFFVTTYRSPLLVAAIVFLVLTYVAPRMATLVPRLLGPTGRFNALGIALIAMVCGATHGVAVAYIP